jgi:hypothetical protein
MLAANLQTLILVTINSGIIPTVCDLIANLERHLTKSNRQVAIMQKNYFFQLMNYVIIQITLSTTIEAFLKDIDWQNLDFAKIQEILFKGYINIYFITIAIQFTFITNGI